MQSACRPTVYTEGLYMWPTHAYSEGDCRFKNEESQLSRSWASWPWYAGDLQLNNYAGWGGVTKSPFSDFQFICSKMMDWWKCLVWIIVQIAGPVSACIAMAEGGLATA